METGLYYTLNTIAQTLAGALAVLVAVVLFNFTRIDTLSLPVLASHMRRAPAKTTMDETVNLDWLRFSKLTEARSRFAKISCVYIQADSRGCPIRVGKASEGLEARYRGGTGYAIDAAMHESGNLVFVAAIEKDICGRVEDELIWQGRRCLTYNNQGKIIAPLRRVLLAHSGTPPILNEFEAGMAGA